MWPKFGARGGAVGWGNALQAQVILAWYIAVNMWSAVGWRTALQVGRSRVRFPMVSLEFFIDIILPAALWPWGRISLYQQWVPGIFPAGYRRPGRKVDNLTNFMCRLVWKNGSLKLLEHSEPVQVSKGIVYLLYVTSVTILIDCSYIDVCRWQGTPFNFTKT